MLNIEHNSENNKQNNKNQVQNQVQLAVQTWQNHFRKLKTFKLEQRGGWKVASFCLIHQYADTSSSL